MPCGHSQLLFTCPVGIHDPHSFILSLICPVVISMPYGLFLIVTHIPRGYSHLALWALTLCPMGIPIMPCGHSQQALMPRGLPQTCPFQRRFTLPLFALEAFPICAYMPGGHSQSLHVPSVPHMPCGIRYALVGLPTRPPIRPVGSPIKPRGYS